jgi:flagellar basal-body rod protein FlgG
MRVVLLSLLILLGVGCRSSRGRTGDHAKPLAPAGDHVALLAQGLRFAEELRAQNEEALAHAYLIKLESIAYNLAHSQRAGFKKCSLPMEQLLNSDARTFLELGSEKSLAALLLQCSTAACYPRMFSQGELVQTGERMDLAIQGEGFFEVEQPDGRRAYTRAGDMRLDQFGRILTKERLPVSGGMPPISEGITSIIFSPNGESFSDGPNGRTSWRISLSRFKNVAGLKPIGPALFEETYESGPAEVCNPGENGCGQIVQGFLEGPNMRTADELVELIQAQRLCSERVRKSKLAPR